MGFAETHGGWQLYHYSPSTAAAIIFVVLFALASMVHTYDMIRTKTWYLLPFVIGGFFETVGYVGRAASTAQTPDWTLGPYIVQSLLLLLAPILFAASIYMELGRIILLTDGESYCLVKRQRLTRLFVTGDVVCFWIQAGGAGFMASSNNGSVKMGQLIVIGGLCLQLIFFGCFVAVASLFHQRMLQIPTKRGSDPEIEWQKHQAALYGSSIFIVLRSAYRMVEYIQGNDGYVMGHEWSLYVFDSCLMLGVMFWFLFVHPSEINAMLRGGRFAKWGGCKIGYRTRAETVSGDPGQNADERVQMG